MNEIDLQKKVFGGYRNIVSSSYVSAIGETYNQTMMDTPKWRRYVMTPWNKTTRYSTIEDLDPQRLLANATPVRWVKAPPNVPEIGRRIEKVVESIPLLRNSCYETSFLLSVLIPGVSVCVGWYNVEGALTRRHLEDLQRVPKRSKKMMRKETYRHIMARNAGIKGLKSGIHKGDYYIGHAWNEYRGSHFDVLCYYLYRNVDPKTWYSKTQRKNIWWRKYLLCRINKPMFDGGDEGTLYRTLGGISDLSDRLMHYSRIALKLGHQHGIRAAQDYIKKNIKYPQSHDMLGYLCKRIDK